MKQCQGSSWRYACCVTCSVYEFVYETVRQRWCYVFFVLFKKSYPSWPTIHLFFIFCIVNQTNILIIKPVNKNMIFDLDIGLHYNNIILQLTLKYEFMIFIHCFMLVFCFCFWQSSTNVKSFKHQQHQLSACILHRKYIKKCIHQSWSSFRHIDINIEPLCYHIWHIICSLFLASLMTGLPSDFTGNKFFHNTLKVSSSLLNSSLWANEVGVVRC